MGRLIGLLILTLSLSSCAWDYVKTPDIQAWRLAFATDAEFTHLSFNPQTKLFEIDGTKSLQSKGTEAAVKGAVEGAVSGIIPIPGNLLKP